MSGIEILFLVLAFLNFLLAAGLCATVLAGARTVRHLRDSPPLSDSEAPSLSVVIPARNEAGQIGPALSSVLAQDYPGLEVLVVDDRSSDGTGEILDRMARDRGGLRVLHVTGLPPGWMGKNHALQAGADAARGEFLLFTDADVHFAPDALRNAMAFAAERRLDHLAVSPELVARTLPLRGVLGVFAFVFAAYLRPWKARDPQSACSVGLGAFNLVRASAYRAAGGHGPIRMRPDDDVRLGRLLKRSGARQELALGRGFVSVAWYPDLCSMARGLLKNSFALVEYRAGLQLAAAAGTLLTQVFPFLAPLLPVGPARWVYLAAALLLALGSAVHAPRHGLPAWSGLAYPFAMAFFVGTGLASMATVLRDGGVVWRGTLYSLVELKSLRSES